MGFPVARYASLQRQDERSSQYLRLVGAIAGMIRFRLYPFADASGLYFLVLIFPTKKAMVRYERRIRRWKACFSAMEVRRDGKLQPLAGELVFNRDNLGINIVAHEILHATLEWVRRRRMDFSAILSGDGRYNEHECPEEQMCFAHGEMVKQFYDRIRKLGLA